MNARLFTIGSARRWPSYTPAVIGDLPCHMWLSLALMCDARVQAEKDRAAELRNTTPGR